MPVRKAPIILRGPDYAAIRAYRAENREQVYLRELSFLGATAPGSAARLARALRAERRAALSGRGYDLTRHYALIRLLGAATAHNDFAAAGAAERYAGGRRSRACVAPLSCGPWRGALVQVRTDPAGADPCPIPPTARKS